MRLQSLWASIAFANAAAAQFIFPDASSSLQINQAIQIRWNQAGLQAPLSINLVPAGNIIRQDVVLKQVAVNIGNVGVLQWTADQSIAAFPQFAMVIIDANSRVVVSQPFLIQSLIIQPSQQIDLGGGNRNGNKQNGDNRNKDNGKKNGDNDKNKGDNKGDNKDKNQDNKEKENKEKENKDKENKDKENKDKENKEKENKDKENKDKENKDKENKDKENKADQEKEESTEKQESSESSSTTLLPLPGLDSAPPASLQPLPTVASVPVSTPAATPEASPATPSPSPSATAASKAALEALPTPSGSATVKTSSALRQVKAEAVAPPARSETADALLIIPGASFREQTSEAPVPTKLPSLDGQETITTAITPRPASLVSSVLAAGEETTRSSSPAGGAKPTIMSEGGAERRGPSLALGVAGALIGAALL